MFDLYLYANIHWIYWCYSRFALHNVILNMRITSISGVNYTKSQQYQYRIALECNEMKGNNCIYCCWNVIVLFYETISVVCAEYGRFGGLLWSKDHWIEVHYYYDSALMNKIVSCFLWIFLILYWQKRLKTFKIHVNNKIVLFDPTVLCYYVGQSPSSPPPETSVCVLLKQFKVLLNWIITRAMGNALVGSSNLDLNAKST